MVAPSPTAELRTKIRTLDLIERLNPTPGFVAYCARNVDLQSDDRHKTLFTTKSQRRRGKRRKEVLCESPVEAFSCEQMIKHEVNDDTRHRDVHPQWEGPARDHSVA